MNNLSYYTKGLVFGERDSAPVAGSGPIVDGQSRGKRRRSTPKESKNTGRRGKMTGTLPDLPHAGCQAVDADSEITRERYRRRE